MSAAMRTTVPFTRRYLPLGQNPTLITKHEKVFILEILFLEKKFLVTENDLIWNVIII